jgi:hypothetical protein
MDIRLKSVGVLIDELFSTDHKCWEAQEEIMKNAHRPAVQGAAAMKAQQLNARRNQLIRAIDESLGQSNLSPTDKTYA